MRYYLREKVPETGEVYKAGKMRDDIEEAMKIIGFGEIVITASPNVNLKTYRGFRDSFESLQEGDSLVVQAPFMTSVVMMRRLFKSLEKRGIKTYIIMHDLSDFLEKCTSLCKVCSGIIVNNEKTAFELIKQKLDIERIVPMGYYDYLIPDGISGSCGEFSLKGPVIVAGRLSREEAGYIYHLPTNHNFRIYGNGYEGEVTDTIAYGGEYRPNDLPFALKGSFGLVWTGTSPMTCLGLSGEVLKTYNPHQLSLYLSAGLPVIVWSESAAADFVIQKGCGFTVGSLAEISYRINSMSEKTYNKMRRNAEEIGIPMRDGGYTRTAIIKMCDE